MAKKLNNTKGSIITPINNVKNLKDLQDVDLTGLNDKQVLQYNESEGKWKPVSVGSATGGASQFTELTDTPNSYTGNANKILKVKSDESGLEFVDAQDSDEKVALNSTSTPKYLEDLIDNATIKSNGTNIYVDGNELNVDKVDGYDVDDTKTTGVLWSSDKIQSSIQNAVSTKADKVSGATAGNFAGLDANGNLVDSGKKASDFASVNHTHTSADISDFNQASQDAVGSILTDTASVNLTYDNVNNQIKADVKVDGTTLEIDNVNSNIKVKDNVFANKVHTHTASDISDFNTAVANHPDVSANTSARHTHSNKAVLDVITNTGDGTKFLADDGTYKSISTSPGGGNGLKPWIENKTVNISTGNTQTININCGNVDPNTTVSVLDTSIANITSYTVNTYKDITVNIEGLAEGQTELKLHNGSLDSFGGPFVINVTSYPAGLYARFALDGDLTDSSGNGRDLTVGFGTPTFKTEGSTTYIDTTNNTFGAYWNGNGGVSNQWTFYAEVRNVGTGMWQTIFGGRNNDDIAISITNSSNKYRFLGYSSSGGTQYDYSSNVSIDGNWHKIAVSYNNGTIKIYIDGVYQTTLTGNLGFTCDTFFADIYNSQNEDFRGEVNEIMVFDRALSDTEAQQITS